MVETAQASMTIGEPMMIFLFAQSLAVVGAVLIAYMRTQILVAEIKVQISALHAIIESVRTDQGALKDKVDGISRHVAVVEGIELEKERRSRARRDQRITAQSKQGDVHNE